MAQIKPNSLRPMAFITFPLSLPHAVNFRLARMLPMLRFRQSAGGIDRELHFSDMAVTTSAPQPFSLVPSQFGPPAFSREGKRKSGRANRTRVYSVLMTGLAGSAMASLSNSSKAERTWEGHSAANETRGPK